MRTDDYIVLHVARQDIKAARKEADDFVMKWNNFIPGRFKVSAIQSNPETGYFECFISPDWRSPYDGS